MVRIFQRVGEDIEDTSETYELTELGGEIPQVGDLIINPLGPRTYMERKDPSRREVHEVKTRYFRPGVYDGPDKYVVLVVETRAATTAEIEFL